MPTPDAGATPGLTLVLGPPASGKTERLIEVAAARYAAAPFAETLVLVPTARHADQFRRRLVARTKVAFGVDVTTFGLYAARHAPAAPVASVEVARELLGRVTRELARGDGPAARFAPIADAPGLRALVASAVADLAADGVDPARFEAAARATTDLDLRALAAIYAAYRAALEARGWREPAERVLLAAAGVRAAATVPPLVLIDGAAYLQRGDVALVAALAERAEVWCALDPEAGERGAWSLAALSDAVPAATRETLPDPAAATDIEASSAADAESQLREIARAIKARLGADPALRPSDFAVTFRQVTPHLALARRVFEEARLPLDPAAGERLAARPFGAWLLQLLRVGVHGWRVRDVADALSAGFASWARFGFAGPDLDRVRRIARTSSLWSSLEVLRRIPAAVESAGAGRSDADDYGRAAAAWSAAVEAFARVLDPETRRTPGAHARALDDALFGAEAWVHTDLEAYPTLAVELDALRAELRAFAAVEQALGADEVPFEAFVADLEARMERPSTLIREAGGVLLAPMHTVAGLRFAHVFVGGLSEGEFPAPQRTGALLDRDARGALAAAGLALPPEPRAAEDDLWRVVRSRADRATSLWRTRLNASGRPAAASYYFESAGVAVEEVRTAVAPERAASVRELAIGLVGGWPAEVRRPSDLPAWERVVRVAAPVEQRRRSFSPAGPHEGALPGADVAWLLEGERRWSPTQIESYQTCAFQFFGGYALHLRELDEEQGQGDARTRGSVVHEILEAAIAPLVARGEALDSSNLDEVITHIRAQGRVTWDAAPERYAFGRAALWRYEGDLALDQLESLVRREARANEALGITSTEPGERGFDAEVPGAEPPLRFRGSIDRLDRGPGLIQIVDYKSGKALERSEVEKGRLLQLQLYALAAQQIFGQARVVARYAFLRAPKAEWALDSARPEDRELLDAAAERAIEAREGIADGEFRVAPNVDKCPWYCAFQHACRVNSFSRRKQWS
ncbi:MAG: PD-(D/E)XK nuclease family protein [Dehalococcoidia bacterium]